MIAFIYCTIFIIVSCIILTVQRYIQFFVAVRLTVFAHTIDHFDKPHVPKYSIDSLIASHTNDLDAMCNKGYTNIIAWLTVCLFACVSASLHFISRICAPFVSFKCVCVPV